MRCDIAVEGHTGFGVGDPSMHFAKKGQPGLQHGHKAGVDRLRQDQDHKPTNLARGDWVRVWCGPRISKDRNCTWQKLYMACMEHTHNKEEEYNSWRSRQDICAETVGSGWADWA